MEVIIKFARAMLAAVFGVLLLAANTASAKTIVIQSSGPSASSYPTGRVLQEPLSIDLRSGGTIKILDTAGTRVLTGPRKIRDANPRKMANEKQLALTSLLSGRAERRSRTGAVRSVDGDASEDQLSDANSNPQSREGNGQVDRLQALNMLDYSS